MAVIRGAVGTGALLAANVKPDIDQVLKVLEPYQYPFTTWLMFINKKSKEVKNKYGKFEWFEKAFVPHQTQVSAAVSESSGLTFTASNLDSVDFFNVGDIILIEETGEVGYVANSGTTLGTTIVVQHIDGSSTLTDITEVDSWVKVIGSDNYEYTATSGRVAVINKEVNTYNYLNIFNKYVTTSGREEAGEAWTDGLSHDELVEQTIKELRLEAERYLMFAPERGFKTSGHCGS